MTRTEERLLDAMQASAGRVRDDRLRPLPDLQPGTRRMAGRMAGRIGGRIGGRMAGRGTARGTGRRKAWRGWLGPAAAAVSVALVIGLAATLAGGTSGRPASGPSAPASGMAGLPRYFPQFTGTDSPSLTLDLRSTSTGAVVASAPSPRVPGWTLMFNAVAASPDGRTFYVDYEATRIAKSAVTRQFWIYRLTITNSALATPLARIKGGVLLDGAYAGVLAGMAVSPDGAKLALTAATGPLTSGSQGSTDKIVVIDLRTGARSTWQGGLYRAGRILTISDLSWTADGRSLVFLALWCTSAAAPNVCEGASGPAGFRAAQVRSVSVGTGGGALDRGALLLTESARYPFIADAVAGPEAGELNLVVLSGRPAGASGPWPEIAVERVSAFTGSLKGVEYRSASPGEGQQLEHVGTDPSGRYLLLTYGGRSGFSTGWINDGKLLFLPITQPYLGYPITTW